MHKHNLLGRSNQTFQSKERCIWASFRACLLVFLLNYKGTHNGVGEEEGLLAGLFFLAIGKILVSIWGQCRNRDTSGTKAAATSREQSEEKTQQHSLLPPSSRQKRLHGDANGLFTSTSTITENQHNYILLIESDS